MDDSSLSYKTLRNVSFSFLGYTLPILFSVFATPIIVHKLGVNDYGVYVLVNTINGFLLLIDLGLSVSIIKFVSEYLAEKNTGKLQSLIGSANSLFAIFGTVGMVVFFLLGKFFLPLFHISSQSREHIFFVFALGGILFFLNSITQLYIALLRSMQRYDLSVKLGLAQVVLFNMFAVAAVFLGYKLKVILGINIVITGIFFIVAFKIFYSLRKEVTFALHWDKAEIKRSYRFGLEVFVANISTNSLAQLDRLLIPVYLGTSSLTYYSIPGNIAEKLNGIMSSSTGIFFPVMSSLKVLGKDEQIKDIYQKVFRNVMVIGAGFALPVIFFPKEILFYWVGQDFAQKGAVILIILAITNYLLGIYGVLISFLFGLGQTRFLIKSSVVMALVNVVLLIVLMPKYGILGAAVAYLAGLLPIIGVFHQVEKNILFLGSRGMFYLKLYLKILLTFLLVGVPVSFFLRPYITNLASLIAVAILSFAVYMFLFYLFGFFEKNDLEVYKNLAVKIKSNFSTK